MPIVSARDNENNRWNRNVQKTKQSKTKKNKQRQKRTRGERNYNERVRAKWFCCALKLGFFQLICKAL